MDKSDQAYATTKLSSRGQVVIPEEIRHRLGLKPGTQFVIVGEGDVVMLKSITPPKVAEFEGLLEQARRAAKASGLKPGDIRQAIVETRRSR